MPAYLYRSAGGDLTATDRASAVALLTALGSSYEGQVRIVVAGETIGRVAWVGAAIEDLSGYERTAGGYGVVASVDSTTQVTLAAGYTLGTAGRCRLWDKSGGAHLDGGGVEWRRSAAVVTLPDTTGMAAGDVVYSDRLEVSDYAHAVAIETALGTSFNGEIRLVNRTSGAVILRRVVRSGAWTSVEVNFAAVTATPNGIAASVAGAVVTMTAGHSIATAAKTLRVWNTTDGTLIADEASGAWGVTGDDCTMGAATAAAVGVALGAGKVVRMWVEGVSELCIGGAGCAVQLGAGGICYFLGTGLEWPAQTSISTYAALASDTTALVVWHLGATIADSANAHAMWGRSIAGDIGRWGYLRSAAGAYRVAIQTSASTFNAGTTATTPPDERRLDAGGLNFFVAESTPGAQAHAANPAWSTARQTTTLSQSLGAASVTITSIRVA